MKKFTSVLLSVAIVLCFTALGLGSSDGGSGGDGTKEFSNYVPVDNIDEPEYEEDATEYEPVNYGRQKLVNGETYHMNVGDTIELVITELSDAQTYSVKWYGNTCNEITLTQEKNSPVCSITADSPGEAVAGVHFVIQDNGWEQYNYEVTIHVEGEEVTQSDNGGGNYPNGNYDNDFFNNNNFNDGYEPYTYQTPNICSKCSGTGRMPCPSCGGTGNLGPPSYHKCESYYCSGGYVPCPYC